MTAKTLNYIHVQVEEQPKADTIHFRIFPLVILTVNINDKRYTKG